MAVRFKQLDGFIAFTTVARLRSFTAAAAELEVSPQAVSQSLRAFEERLGVRLFNRTTRSVALNEAGERLLARAGPALGDLFDALETVQEFRDRPAGLLRINLPRPAYSGLLQPVLPAFHAAYPDIELELCFDDGFSDIVEPGFDAGIRLGESVVQDMVSVPLSREERIVIVATPDYLARRGVPLSVEDLHAHDCIRFRMPTGGVVYRWELLKDRREIEMQVDGPITVNDTGAMVSAALDGFGLGYVLECTAAAHLASGRLVRVLERACPTLSGFHLYYPSRRQLPAKLRCFIDYWQAHARGLREPAR